jgi:hypothetical protein
MVLALLMVGVLGICWMTYWLLPEAKQHWALLPPAIAVGVVVLSAILFEAFMAWVMLLAVSGNSIGSAVVVLVIHALALLALWRSSR